MVANKRNRTKGRNRWMDGWIDGWKEQEELGLPCQWWTVGRCCLCRRRITLSFSSFSLSLFIPPIFSSFYFCNPIQRQRVKDDTTKRKRSINRMALFRTFHYMPLFHSFVHSFISLPINSYSFLPFNYYQPLVAVAPLAALESPTFCPARQC